MSLSKIQKTSVSQQTREQYLARKLSTTSDGSMTATGYQTPVFWHLAVAVIVATLLSRVVVAFLPKAVPFLMAIAMGAVAHGLVLSVLYVRRTVHFDAATRMLRMDTRQGFFRRRTMSIPFSNIEDVLIVPVNRFGSDSMPVQDVGLRVRTSTEELAVVNIAGGHWDTKGVGEKVRSLVLSDQRAPV